MAEEAQAVDNVVSIDSKFQTNCSAEQMQNLLVKTLTDSNNQILTELNNAFTLVFDALKSKIPVVLNSAAKEILAVYSNPK
ncbi:MAG TPA: hypothetical protein PLJ37_00570 [Chitinophagales bacterium]|nr:hypothetical protein [Chitinophagales bacterium]HMW93446.1 hypothetical protein [Chitinophagales bacterium]HMZ92931.1 hypothetical protein [Chitinophagales bacterium]HNG25879.1 hypothetical protein [Chitinophagales bacterium]